MELKEALEKIRSDKSLARKFTEGPEKALADLGVDTASLKIQAVPAELVPMIKGKSGVVMAPSQAAGVGVSACVSIGCVVCASVGV